MGDSPDDDGPWYWNPERGRMQRQPPVVSAARFGTVRTRPESRWRRFTGSIAGFFRRHRKACLVALAVVVVAAAIFAGRLAFTAPAVNVTAPTGKAAQPLPTSALPSTASAPSPAPQIPATSAAAATSTSDHYDEGVCLSGTIPDTSGVEVPAGDLTEVPCSSKAAHYKVIHALTGTSDLHQCDTYRNPRTPFSFGEQYTMNGVPVEQYVYCMIEVKK
ncbi:hypothetical protein [Amycolatopsis sp. NPDC051903]|uniref:LppU/SCO3897 family protein n=1 Tax=Amycolatopsis sp. NPDC051903 TaxID=3363936 RepID=UPI0037902215